MFPSHASIPPRPCSYHIVCTPLPVPDDHKQGAVLNALKAVSDRLFPAEVGLMEHHFGARAVEVGARAGEGIHARLNWVRSCSKFFTEGVFHRSAYVVSGCKYVIYGELGQLAELVNVWGGETVDNVNELRGVGRGELA